MIPPTTSRAFGSILASPSPRLSEIDLAKIIDRTVRMAIDAKRQLGFAAITTGCDGQKRTSMFDGSACQTEGTQVCIAERQDGITACLEVPMQGAGIVFQSISFRSVPCAPVTGWYVLDDEGYLYRIPTALTAPAAPYWPSETPASEGSFDLVRAGTWAALMCAAALAPPTLNGDGNSEWFVISVEGVPYYTVQRYDAAIGGLLTHLETVPGFTDGSGQTIVAALDGRWSGVYKSKGTTTTATLSQSDVNAATLAAGQEYKALIYAAASGSAITVNVLKGPKGAAGAAVTPDLPSPLIQIPLGVSTVAYGGAVTTVSLGTTTPINLTLMRVLGSGSTAKWRDKGIIQRDGDAPNAGTRHTTLTLPAAGTNVATGDVRIAFGYPLAYWVGGTGLSGSETPPFGIAGSATPVQKAARDDYDMALVYPDAVLGIEYAPYHLNIAGPDVLTPDASEILSTLDTLETRQDTGANLIVLPNNELAISRPYSPSGSPVTPQRFDRYRVRPAPSVPVTVALSQAALGAWPVDPNEWVEWKTRQVNPWTLGATSFTLQSGSWSHGKPVPCVLWQAIGAVTHWTMDVTAKLGQLQQPTAGTATIAFDGGGGAQAPGGGGYTPYITILGTDLVVAYGWTFFIGAEESALSPLTETALTVPTTSTYRRTLTVPLGPTGTTARGLYRFAYDRQAYVNAGGQYESPWLPDGGALGAVYDRMMVKLGEIPDNVTTEFVDTTTTLTYSGDRPPQPFIGPVGGGVTLDRPRRVYALPPLNL